MKLLFALIFIKFAVGEIYVNNFQSPYSSGDDFVSNPSIPRIKSYPYTFPSAFLFPPQVMVALVGFNFPNPQNAGVFVFPSDITTTSFNLKIYVPMGATLDYIQLIWLATDDQNLKVSPVYIGDDLSHGEGERSLSKTIRIPHGLRENGKITAFVSGFQFAGNEDAILSVYGERVNEKHAQVTLKTWGDSKLRQASGVALIYDKSDFYYRTFHENVITRHGDTIRYLPLNADFVRLFFALTKFHFLAGYNIGMEAHINVFIESTQFKVISVFTPIDAAKAKLYGTSLVIPKS